jgi:hypothetical protein
LLLFLDKLIPHDVFASVLWMDAIAFSGSKKMLIYGTVLLNILRTSIIFDVELTSCRLYISLPQRRRVLGCGFKSADYDR